MTKLSLASAILLLSSAWMVASNLPAAQNPAGSAQSAQEPDKSRTPTSDSSAQAIEGCLSGSANVFVLTDAKGKTYELTGDSSMLNDKVGHKVRLFGHTSSSGGGARTTSQGPQATFGVEKVQSLSPTCK